MQTPPEPHSQTGIVSFVVVVLIIVGGLGAAVYLGVPTSVPTSSSGHPPGNGPFITDTGTSSFTSTASASTGTTGGRAPYPLYLPASPPLGLLYYDNMPFTGLQGSYCWPPSGSGAEVRCADIAGIKPSAVPVVAVYPRPNVTFSSTFWRGIQGVSIELYKGASTDPVFSGRVTGYHPYGFPLNFTSGSYLLSVIDYYGGGADVSSYYNLTAVASPSASVVGGLKIQVGSPEVHYFTMTTPNYTVSGPSWEDWPITVTSNATTDVDLSAASVIYGDWVEFVPSHLTNVGPAGAVAHMLIAGAVRPFVDNDISNVSLMIRASGQGGELGQVLIPMEGSEYITVFRSSAPSNITTGVHPFQATRGQTDYGAYSLVYDPGGVPSNTSLQVDLSIVGVINGTQVNGVPTWLALSLLNPSVTLQAYQPVYLRLSARAAADAPVGDYALLLRAVADGKTSYLVVPFSVVNPINNGPV